MSLRPDAVIRIELGARAAWLLLRNKGVTRLDTWLAHHGDAPWRHTKTEQRSWADRQGSLM